MTLSLYKCLLQQFVSTITKEYEEEIIITATATTTTTAVVVV